MNKRLLVFILTIISLLFPTYLPVVGKEVEKNPQANQIKAKQLDKQAEILAAYLANHDSPLQYHAQDFVDAAREYDLDWRLVPAIAGVESTFGKFTPGGYNGWGWGVYGTQAVYFKSWKEGIFTVTEGLREKYANRGLTNPYLMNKAYATSPRWGSKVTYFMKDIDRFAKKYELAQTVAEVSIPTRKIAAISGQLVAR